MTMRGSTGFVIFCGLLCCSLSLQIKRQKRSFKDSFIPKDSSGNDGSEKYGAILTRLEKAESKLESVVANMTLLQDGFGNVSKVVQQSEKRFAELSSKLHDVEVSVDMDENYWNYSATCGGIMVGQSGQIVHTETLRLTTAASARSSCVWTIRANNRAHIQLVLSSTYPVEVTEFFIADDGTHTVKNTAVISTRSYIFHGPVILVSAPSRSVSLTYSGHGKLVHEDTLFRHYYFQEYNGTFTFNTNLTTAKRVFTTVVINTYTSDLLELDVQLPINCRNSSLNVDMGGYEDQDNQVSTCCQGSSCPTHLRRYTLDGWFTITRSSLIPQSEEVKLTWHSRGNHSNSIDKCGGLLMGKGGRISYKKYINYANNERCVWVIYPFPKNNVVFSQLTTYFETTYDHLSVWEVDKDRIESTTLTSTLIYAGTKSYTGRVVLLTFYTDSSVVRQGFDVMWEAKGPSDNSRSLDAEKIFHNSFKSDLNIVTVALQSKTFALFVITATELDASSISINVAKKSGTACSDSHLKVIGSTSGHLDESGSSSVSTKLCNSATTFWNITSLDGIGVILLENKESQAHVQVELAWKFVRLETVELDMQNKCGGVIHGASGRLTYKLDYMYENGERCVWLIHSVTSSEIQLKLIKDGFELCCDYLIVNSIDPSTGQIINTTALLTRENNTRVFPGNLLIVTFRSDSSIPGRGFVLEFTGRGQKNYSHKFKLFHQEELEGSFLYKKRDSSSSSMWREDGDGYVDYEEEDDTQNEILVVAYSTPVEIGEGSTALIFNVTIENMVFGVDLACDSDILNLYTAPSRDGFTLAESYPKMNCQRTLNGCGNCVPSKLIENDTTPHTFSSMFRAFVGIYKPVKSSLINNQTFHVHWESSSGCGGVIMEDEGRIAYKLGSRYKNLEQCIWTVHIPEASKIHFLLLSNGFELCCDNVILTSLDPTNGTLGTSAILKSDSTSALMDGPVVFVTFRSDGSVTGEGFALIYSAFSSTNESFTSTSSGETSVEIQPKPTPLVETGYRYRYHHVHLRRRNYTFTYPSPVYPKMGVNEILTLTYSPEPWKNETFLRFGTKISISQLGLDVNNQSCTSDSLRFYETLTRLGFDESKSYEVNIPDANNCTVLEREWSCGNCLANETQQEVNIVPIAYPAFIAIYKSASNASDLKSFKIEWVDTPRTSDASTTTLRTTRYSGWAGRSARY